MTQFELFKAIRFPLVSLVIIAHMLPFEAKDVTYELSMDNCYAFISEFISHGMGTARNPLFFTLSGFLFIGGG